MTTELADDVGFDEAPTDESSDAAQAVAANSKPALALVMQKNLTRIQTAMADLDRVESELPDVEKQFAKDVVYEITTTKGMKSAIEHRAAWRDRRITVEKARTMAKAPILELGRHVDSRAKRLAEQLRLGEEPIDQQIKAEEKRKEDDRQARINAEAGRVLAIQEALAGIGQDVLIACSKTSADIQLLIDRMSSAQPDPLVFQEQIDQARAAWTAALAKLDTALKAKRWEEAEAKRIADERAAEAARRLEEEARLARVADEQAQAAHVLAEERAKLDRDLAELAALRAAMAPPPVPPAPAPQPAPAPVEPVVQDPPRVFDRHVQSDPAGAAGAAAPSAHVAPQIAADDVPGLALDSGEFVPACDLNALETSEGDAQPAAPEVVRAALEQSLPSWRVAPTHRVVAPATVAAFLDHVMGAFETKFQSQPKPSVEWWAETRELGRKLQQQIGGAA